MHAPFIHPAPSQKTSPVAARLIYALTPEARRHFQPHFEEAMEAEGFPATATIEWIEVKAGGEGNRMWHPILEEESPLVLVTSWGTPTLPVEAAVAPGLPLRYLCHLAGSVRSIIPRALIERGVLVSNWGNSISHTVAEHALLLVLGALRNAPLWGDFLRNPPVRPTPFSVFSLRTRCLRGKRVGIHGFGAVARELVALLRPFQVEIAAYSQGVPPALFQGEDVHRCESLEELFASSDVLIECEALTAASRHSVTRALLLLLPPEAVFVNVGRGAVVDEEALIEIAAERSLRLGLDVYQNEPLPADSPIWGLTRALLSPHAAGPTEDTLSSMVAFAIGNLHRHFAGDRPEGLVTADSYDRMT